MSACWGSRGKGGVPARIGLVLAMIALAQGAGAASRSIEHVRVGPGGVVVERSGNDSVDVHVDSKGRTAERDGHGGWIEVDDHGDALVRVFGDIHVPPGKRVNDDVVAVFGS